MTLRAFIYDRNSFTSKRGSTSTEYQNDENRRFCTSQGWILVDVFEDGGRGASRYSKKSRPDYELMIDRLRAGIRPGAPHAECDVLVIWGASRYARNLPAYVQLRDVLEKGSVLLCYNGKLFDLSKGDDRYITGVDALQAEREAETIHDGAVRTTRGNAERGRPHGRTGYGFEREYDSHTGRLLGQHAHPQQQPVLFEMTRRVANGGSCSGIVRDLNERGVQPPSGSREWRDDHIKRMVTRPANIGKRQYQGTVIGEATWDAIVDVEDYYACLKIFSDPSRRATRDGAVRHFLGGILRCGLCDPEFNQRLAIHGGTRYNQYVCKRCGSVAIGERKIDRFVERTLLGYIERPEFRVALSATSGDAARVAHAEAEALETQLKEARVLATTMKGARMALSAASLAALELTLMPMIDAAHLRARDATVPPVIHELGGPGARERWNGLDLLQQRVVVRGVARMWLMPCAPGTYAITPERLRWEWIR